MLLTPTNLDELRRLLAEAHQQGQKVIGYDLRALSRVVEYTPEDMVVTVEAGITLAALQEHIAHGNQWLPIDPPFADMLSVGALLAGNANGPRRFGYGTARDHLIGIKVVLADGRLIKAGGKVVKNVAGYDLCKLFVGSRGTLGVIVEATFKLLPRPSVETFVQHRVPSLAQADALIEKVMESELTPHVLDLHNQNAGAALALVLGFAGTREEVDWSLARAAELGFAEPGSLDHENAFWSAGDRHAVRKLSVLPSRVVEAIQGLGEVPFVARAGNGIVYYRGGPEPPKEELPAALLRRMKETYDPKGILPDLVL
ncbi:MAG: FAD-binding oxidoreductase [Verrucomicrobiota bacterium]